MSIDAMKQALIALELEMKGYAAKHARLMPAAHALRLAIEQQKPLEDFIARLLDPEDLGHAVTAEVRQKASALLGRGRA